MHHYIRKKIRAVLCVFAALMMMAGCTVQEKKEVIEITFMHGWGGNLKTHQLMQEIYDGFGKKNPDIRLRMVPYADSTIAVEKANDMLAVGKMPDIISTNGYSYFVMNAAKREKALDLMPYIEKDKELGEKIHPAVFATWQTGNGKLYTVPDAIEAAGYWYNRDYFAKAGITDEHGEARVPATWEEFFGSLEILQNYLKENEPEVSLCNLESNQLLEFFFLARLAGEGEKGWNMANNPSAEMDAQTMRTVMTDIKILQTYSVDVENIESARQNFLKGKCVIYFNGVWESGALSESSMVDQFGYADYPTKEGKSLSYVSASSGYVLARQEDKKKEEACIRFLKYMLSDEVQTKLAIETDQAPSSPNIPADKIKAEKPLLGMAIEEVYASDQKISTIRSIWPEEKFSVISEAILNRRYGEEDIEKMVEKLN